MHIFTPQTISSSSIRHLCRVMLVCSLSVILSGCSAALMVGGVAIATKSVTDARPLGRQIDDGTLQLRISKAISLAAYYGADTVRIFATVYKGHILLTGQVPNAAIYHQVLQTVSAIPGGETIYNEVRISTPASLLDRAESSWITTKIMTHMMATDPSLSKAIKVVTEAGEVFLFGSAAHQKQLIKVVQSIHGVKNIITVFV